MRRYREMIAKDDKDGQIKLLREALEKIHKIAESYGHDDWTKQSVIEEITCISNTALIDTTF